MFVLLALSELRELLRDDFKELILASRRGDFKESYITVTVFRSCLIDILIEFIFIFSVLCVVNFWKTLS